jgi:hypothetical protein
LEHFLTKAGPVDGLKSCQRCGARPCAIQIICTVETASPTASAIARTVYCVTLSGDAERMRRTTSEACSSGTGAVPGGRGLSHKSPSTPSAMNRSCHYQTAVFHTSASRMIWFMPAPAEVRSTTRAHQTSFCGLLRSDMIVSRRRRSSTVTVLAIQYASPTRAQATPLRIRFRDSFVSINPLEH